MAERIAYSTDPTYFTVMYRQKGSRRFYRCGYRFKSTAEARKFATTDMNAGRYAAAKIVRWDTEELIEKV